MIQLINPNEFLKSVGAKGPVSTPHVFIGKSDQFHPEGLFSEEFFGIEGSDEYRNNFSWIELNTKIITPFLYVLLTTKIERKIKDVIEGNKRFSLDKNGYLVEDESGDIIGLSSLVEHIDKIKFRKDYYEDDEDKFGRSSLLKKIYEFIRTGVFFVDKVIVIPPFYRPVNIQPDGSKYLDKMNEYYIKIINLSMQLQNLSGNVKDIISYKMQNAVNELYEYVKIKVSKKSGLIRNLMLGRPVDFSARAVITPNPHIGLGYVGIPLRLACQIFEPFILYGIFNSPYSKDIPAEFFDTIREYLRKERIY